jgi:hypothetical protein
MTTYGFASRDRAAYSIQSYFHPKAGVIREEKLRDGNDSLPPVDGRGQKTQQAVSDASSDLDVVIIRI